MFPLPPIGALFIASHAGEVAHLEVFGSHVIVLGSAESVKDLLERRSSNYSDRPFFTMATEL